MTLLCDTEKLSPVSKNKQTNNKNTYTHTKKEKTEAVIME